MDRIYLDNDMVATLPDLKDDAGQTITTAAVEMTLFKRDKETEVAGQTWPATLTHQNGGTYKGDLSRGIQVSNGQIVALKIVATYNGKQLTGWKNAYVERRDLDA